jgi:hypothetical protein
MTARTQEHTPGPWAANKDGRVHSTTATEWSRNFNCEIAAYVAHTGGPDHAANARLIAAAPDLLAVLERVPPLRGQGGAND